MIKKRFVLFGHGGSFNRGCEAIVKTTVEILKDSIKDELSISLISTRSYEDMVSEVKENCSIINYEIPRKYSIKWFCLKVISYISRGLGFKLFNHKIISEIKKSDVMISIGGDNYCYGEPVRYYDIDNISKKNNKKLVLWGASVEPSMLTPRKCKDLSCFDLIVARESITYNALKANGINKNILLYPDPAFTLQKDCTYNYINNDNVIGINISPLVFRFENISGIGMKSLKSLINYIINETKHEIALIPHVTHKDNNDYTLLKKIFEEFDLPNRITLIPDNLTASQYKGVISKCRFLVAARTHASIAGYSSCVPTLVLGYSVKAIGIATDLFGTDTNFVLPIQSIKNEDDLKKSFIWLCQHESEIREHLQSIMPDYTNKAWKAGDEIRILLDK